MNLFDYIDDQTVEFNVEESSWKDAICYAGSLLEKAGYIEHQYTEDMISLVETLGAYIVVMPGVALAHARPQGHVTKNSIAIITLKEGINFGHEANDPVRVVFAIAAVDDDEHLKLFQSVANYLIEDSSLERILNAEKIDDLKGEESDEQNQ